MRSSFDDLDGDESEFFVVKPAKAHDTAQKAMAAYGGKFEYGGRLKII